MFESADRFWLEPVPPKSTPQPPADTPSNKAASDVYTLRAIGRLANAREVFAHRGWKTLPQGSPEQRERSFRILRWGADHAWTACPSNPRRSVRRWCRHKAPWLTKDELKKLVTDAATSNKRWSDDESARVLEITLAEREAIERDMSDRDIGGGLKFLGVTDDPHYEARDNIKRAKAAARARKCRAKHSTGAKRGRPKSEGPKAWEVLGISKATYYRQRETETRRKSLKLPKKRETKNASRRIISLRKRYAISVSHCQPHRPQLDSNENRRR